MARLLTWVRRLTPAQHLALWGRMEKLQSRSVETIEAMKDVRRDIRSHSERIAETRADLVKAMREMARHDAVAALAASIGRCEETLVRIAGGLDALEERLRVASVRAEQFTALQRENRIPRKLPVELASLDLDRTCAHATAAIRSARLLDHPCRYLVVENLMPADVYDTIIAALPARIFFEEGPLNRQELRLPLEVAPGISLRVWDFTFDLTKRCLVPALVDRFEPVLRSYLAGTFPGCNASGEPLEFRLKDARILLRRPGYLIRPHRDPKWGFLSCLFYLARPGDPDDYGTQLYSVRADQAAPSPKPYYPDPDQCSLVTSVPFRANTALVFLNSVGAHGAAIPPDAEPGLERYLYTFRFGPNRDLSQRLKTCLPEPERRQWEKSQAGDDDE